MCKTGYLTVKSPSLIELLQAPLVFNAVLRLQTITHENYFYFPDFYSNNG